MKPKTLTTEIEEVRFIKPGEEKPGDEILDDTERERYMRHFLATIARIEKEFAEYKEMGPTKERTVCVRRKSVYRENIEPKEPKKS
jgi:hypothetical protein